MYMVVRSQVITALGRIWHPEHFVCDHCQQELGTRNFFEHIGKAYCERDYHMLYSPRCFHCNGAILDVRLRHTLIFLFLVLLVFCIWHQHL